MAKILKKSGIFQHFRASIHALGIIVANLRTDFNGIYYMAKQKVETGSSQADPKFRITITDKGPYLVFGHPPLAQQHIVPNDKGESWEFREGRHFPTDGQPTALCRCGASGSKPYCDGTHTRHNWNPELSSPPEALLDNVEITSGEDISITDNSRYCVFSRFCDAGSGVWSLAESSKNPQARDMAIREASICPSGRLMAWDNESQKPYEYKYEPSLGLIEDEAIGASGGLWVRGGIRIEREDGQGYEIRNRSVLCRCGMSSNKPYCDGTHASLRWRDGIETVMQNDTEPEKVY